MYLTCLLFRHYFCSLSLQTHDVYLTRVPKTTNHQKLTTFCTLDWWCFIGCTVLYCAVSTSNHQIQGDSSWITQMSASSIGHCLWDTCYMRIILFVKQSFVINRLVYYRYSCKVVKYEGFISKKEIIVLNLISPKVLNKKKHCSSISWTLLPIVHSILIIWHSLV